MSTNDIKQGGEETSATDEESVCDEIELEETEEHTESVIKKLRTKLKGCEAEKRERLEDLQRVKADFLNSKRRLEQQLENDRERATTTVLLNLLPLVDSFDLAVDGMERRPRTEANWKKGIEAIYNQLLALLKEYTVVEIEALGKKFDPQQHEAVSSKPVASEREVDMVVSVLQKGFRRGDTVIRPARVEVGTNST